jgi:DNA-binding Lrp family transcriptional regulator
MAARQVAGGLDDVDQRIVDELRRDGRMSMRALAEKLHISRANAYARVQRLESSGVIRGYSADIDPVLAGLGTSAYVTVNLEQAEWRSVREELRALRGVDQRFTDPRLRTGAAEHGDEQRCQRLRHHPWPGSSEVAPHRVREHP